MQHRALYNKAHAAKDKLLFEQVLLNVESQAGLCDKPESIAERRKPALPVNLAVLMT